MCEEVGELLRGPFQPEELRQRQWRWNGKRQIETYGIYRRDKTFIIFVTFDLAQS